VCIAVAAASVGMWVTPVDVYVKEAELSIYPHCIHSQLERFHPLGGRFSLKTAEEIPVQNYVVIIEKVDSLADNKELCRIALTTAKKKAPQCALARQPFRRPCLKGTQLTAFRLPASTP